MTLPVNSIICGDCVDEMQKFPADSVDLVVTSPPYWGLRDYGKETIRVWGGDPECDHEWNDYTWKQHAGRGDNVQKKAKYSELPSIPDKIVGASFCSECGAWYGSLGLEPHPQMFIDHLVEIFREVKRVLKPSGTFWLNLGDTYYGSGKGAGGDGSAKERYVPSENPVKQKIRSNWLQPKQKLMIPARVAIALQNDGWILRNSIVWHKPNAMPSSVKDRLTNSYEHVFLFVKNNKPAYWTDRFANNLSSVKPKQYYIHKETSEKRFDRPRKTVDINWYNEDGAAKFEYAWRGHTYFFDLDVIRKPHKTKPSGTSKKKQKYGGKFEGFGKESEKYASPRARSERKSDKNYANLVEHHHDENFYHIKGKNPGDMWSISTKPFKGAHFAVFPPALIEPIIQAGCPEWICRKCGKPRIRITETKSIPTRPGNKSKYGNPEEDIRGSIARERRVATHQTIGWSDCGCGEGWVGGIVLDPFCGSGTSCLTAKKFRRQWIGIEINSEYVEMAKERIEAQSIPPISLDQFIEPKEKK